jgi:hypothetical protein
MYPDCPLAGWLPGRALRALPARLRRPAGHGGGDVGVGAGHGRPRAVPVCRRAGCVPVVRPHGRLGAHEGSSSTERNQYEPGCVHVRHHTKCNQHKRCSMRACGVALLCVRTLPGKLLYPPPLSHSHTPDQVATLVSSFLAVATTLKLSGINIDWEIGRVGPTTSSFETSLK